MNRSRSFPNTLWTRVVFASDPAHPGSQTALAELFKLYWYPIYAYLRRSGFAHTDAEDLTQGFFLFALRHHTFQKADRRKGRFRTFVLGCLRNFLSDYNRHRTATKRGGHDRMIEFDGLSAQERYAVEPVDERSPERVFEQKLALEVLDGAMIELEIEAGDEGNGPIFSALRGYLADDGTAESYRTLSVRLNIPEGTLKSHVSRFRKRLRRLLNDRVDQMVASEEDVKSELVALEDSL